MTIFPALAAVGFTAFAVWLARLANPPTHGERATMSATSEPAIVADRITYLYLERVAALDVRDRSSGERKRIFLPCDTHNIDREFKAYRAFCLGEKVDLSCNVKQ